MCKTVFAAYFSTLVQFRVIYTFIDRYVAFDWLLAYARNLKHARTRNQLIGIDGIDESQI